MTDRDKIDKLLDETGEFLNPELKAIIKEHGLLTGQEFLNLTDNNVDLYWEYLDYFDNVVMPRVVENIKIRGSVEDARTLDTHSRKSASND